MPTDPPHPTPAESPAPCPWCGSKAFVSDRRDEFHNCHVICHNFGCAGGPGESTAELAIAAWNSVALAPARLAELEEDMRDQDAVVGIALREGIPTSPSGVTESPIARVKALYEKKVAAEAALKALVEAAEANNELLMMATGEVRWTTQLRDALAAARKVVGETA